MTARCMATPYRLSDRRGKAGFVGLIRRRDHQFRHDHVAGELGEHHHAGGDVFGVHHHRALLGRHRHRPLIEDRRIDLAGMNRRDPDAVLPLFKGHRRSEAGGPELRGAVAGPGQRKSPLAGDRGDAHDQPVAADPHPRQHRLEHVEQAGEIHRHHPIEVGRGEFGHRPLGDVDSGGVDDDRRRPGLGDRPLDQASHRVAVGHVAAAGENSDARTRSGRRGGLCRGPLELCHVAAGDHDPAALSGQGRGHPQADPAAAPGHHRHALFGIAQVCVLRRGSYHGHAARRVIRPAAWSGSRPAWRRPPTR